MTSRKDDDSGVSVIVGTLLLILITVTAAAGLAVMISQMQKDAMNRQTHITAVQNEQLLITGVNFASSPADWDQYWLLDAYNITLNQSYSSVTVSITNLNNQDSGMIGIALNDKYPHNFTVIDDSSQPRFTPYNFSSQDPLSYLVVPASSSKKIRINFTTDFFTPPNNIGPDDQVTIRVMTSLYNTFEKTFQPPNPVILPSTVTQNLGNIQRDVLVLDGSQSYAAPNSTIVDWKWSIQNASATLDSPGNCTDTQNLTTLTYLKGKTVQFQPKSSGPFCANLTVQDNNGMYKSSDYVAIPENDLFVPPAKPRVQFNPPYINVTILDINGDPLPNQVVNYIFNNNPSGNLTLSNYFGETDNAGMNSTMVLGNGNPGGGGTGTVNVVYGNFQPYPAMVSNTTP